jgi:hypothetical protein
VTVLERPLNSANGVQFISQVQTEMPETPHAGIEQLTEAVVPPPTGATEQGVVLPKPPAIWRLLRAVFSFPAMLCVGLALIAVLTVSARFSDPDMWWHLKIGEGIWNTHTIPSADQFSFTAAMHPWVAHEWLSEVSIYAAYKAGGYAGLMVWLASSSSILLILAYTLCYIRTRNALLAFLGGIGVWLFSTVGLAIRPLVLGHIFLASELILLELAARDRRWLWGLPPLFAVWVNCHGSFIFGMFVAAAYWICAVTGRGWGPINCERWSKPARYRFTLACALSAGALLCNPIGLKLVTYPLNILFVQKTNLSAVEEWAAPELHAFRTIALLLSFALIIITPLWRRSTCRTQDVLIVLPAFYLAFQHTRMMFLFGVVAVPVLIAAVAPLLTGGRKRDIPAANAVLMAAYVAAIMWAFPDTASLRKQVEATSPVSAVEYIRKAGLKGPMLNDYTMGGYLMWTLPEQKLFIDGRADIYDWTGVLAEYGRWATLREDPKILLEKYNIRFCVLPSASPMANVIGYLPGWRRVYSDKMSAVYAR